MEWKEKFNKTTNRIADSAKHKVSNKYEQSKAALKDTNAAKFMNSKGAKGKLGFAKDLAANKFKGTNTYRKAQQIYANMQKVASFIASNIYIILILTVIAVVLWNGTIFIIGVSQTVGSTPHYYCDIDADEGIKQAGLYQQYCTNGGSGFNLDNINGHYIVQDGSGPCTCCSLNNLLLRYFTSKDINYYDYLWNETGVYSSEAASAEFSIKSSKSVRTFVNGGSSASTSCTSKGFVNGSAKFAKDNGKPNYNMANWGYIRDESVNYEGKTDAYDDLTSNENWVWDLSLDNAGAGTAWSAAWNSGNSMTIESTTATWKHVEGSWSNGTELKKLLDDHPSGLVVYRQYGAGKFHAILVTGYDDNGFRVVDPGLGCRGGFEGPAKSSNFCIQSIWSQSILDNPAGKNIVSYTYIEEDGK